MKTKATLSKLFFAFAFALFLNSCTAEELETTPTAIEQNETVAGDVIVFKPR